MSILAFLRRPMTLHRDTLRYIEPAIIFGAVTTTLQDARVASALDRMYAESTEQFARLRENRDVFERVAKASAQERADALSEIYMPVTPDAGPSRATRRSWTAVW